MKDLAAPLLEGVRIVNDKADVDPDDFEPPNQAFALTPRVLTGGAPNLVAVHSNNLDNLPPLVNATTLHLGTNNFFSSFEFNTQILTNLAAACPFLSTLSIHGRYVGTLDVAGVAMPSLRFLWFESGNTDTLVATFLTKVEMPNLESLWLDCPHNEVINTVRNHHPRPYFPALKYLTLQRFDYFSSSKFAQVFPTIEALHLSFCSGYHVSFLTGALVQDDLSHWQSLRTLVFRTTSERHIKKLSESINQIVTKRESGGRPVQRVLLDRDLLAALSTEKSVRAFTSLEELRADNYDDPWWIVSHTDTRDRL
ncbi:hypothetical protein DXG01_004969 [Tephrocybe rancida]|nr:hypothetical protein DXG01_004969 [Tephrocybe rancida]